MAEFNPRHPVADGIALTADERIQLLEEKLEDLAWFTGRIVYAFTELAGNNFSLYDCAEDGLLVWGAHDLDEGTVDEETQCWWSYVGTSRAARTRREVASDA